MKDSGAAVRPATGLGSGSEAVPSPADTTQATTRSPLQEPRSRARNLRPRIAAL